jgi:hypothetical protein
MTATPSRHARLLTSAIIAASVCAAFGPLTVASDQSVAVTRFHATVRTHTALRLSDDVLTIAPRVTGDGGPLSAGVIEFRAAARTASDGEVLMTVEPLAPIASLAGGAGDTATTIAFEGSGDGAQSGALSDAHPETVARWVGSGLRTGRLTFTLRGPVSPHGATLPLRFLLAAP